MQEYLFRGKTLRGPWVEGYYGKFRDSCQIFEPREDARFLGSSIGGLWHIVDPETVSQFTGKLDKDGTKIFEGDIVRAKMDYGPGGYFDAIVPIAFEEECGGYEWQYFDMSTIKVIGNRWDNPELLKGDVK